MNATDRELLDEVVARYRANPAVYHYYGVPLSEMTKEDVVAVFHEVMSYESALRAVLRQLSKRGDL